jgi:peptidoglycan hydrolase-like protein with peptidoglycan-binding domain
MWMTAGAVSLMIVAAGCSSTNWPRMGSGNPTSYATGSYPMPPKTAANANSNGNATAQETRTRSTTTANQGTVIAAQEALAKAGFDPGSADGSVGPATQQAVENYQKAHGLRATGELDANTLSSLGVPQQ